MRYARQFVALLLVMSMLFASSGLTVMATDAVVEKENSNVTDSSVTVTDLVQGNNSGQTNEIQKQSAETEKVKIFKYVYIDEETVNIPQEQNIVIAFADLEIVLEKVTLYYSFVDNESKFELEASNIVDNTILFTKEYTDESEVGTYRLDSITYIVEGQSEEISVNFAEQEIVATYIVTTEPEEEQVEVGTAVEEVPEVTVYSIDDSGTQIEESAEEIEDIESAVETTLAIVDEEGTSEKELMTVPTFSIVRTVKSLDDDLVVVICPGHDSTHAGAQANGLSEEKLTFKVAQYCAEELKKYDNVTVYLLRDSVECAYPGQNRNYCLNQRVIDAAELGGDVFVDVHFNSSNGAGAQGAEVYYPNNSYSAAIHEDGETLANNILEQLETLGLKNREAKTKDCTNNIIDENGNLADYFTSIGASKEYGMTGIIVEHAFLDSAGDSAKLKSESFLKSLGVADATGIANAYGLKTNVNSSTTVADSKVEIGAEDTTGKQTSYLLTAANVETVGSFENVYFPVWSDIDGQDDIVWYKATKNSSGTWTTAVNITDHKTAGTYHVHVYGMKADGTMTFVGNTTFEVTKPYITYEDTTQYYAIMGENSVTVSQLIAYYNSSGRSYPSEALSEGGAATIEEFCKLYYEEATAEGVRVEVAFAQAMKETGFLQYGGIVKVSQFNFAGLGALDGNEEGNCAAFVDVRTGIRAQIQHLKAYASTEDLKNACVDPRFHLVKRGVAPYVEWLGIKENPLGYGWATAEGYGASIVTYINKIKQM